MPAVYDRSFAFNLTHRLVTVALFGYKTKKDFRASGRRLSSSNDRPSKRKLKKKKMKEKKRNKKDSIDHNFVEFNYEFVK